MARLRAALRRFGETTIEATRRYFAAGLLAIAPLAITIWAVSWIIQRLDNLLLPRVIELFDVGREGAVQSPPFVGALFTFLVILMAGVVVRHLFGAELVRVGERLLARVPIARSIYGGVKQLVEAIFRQNSHASFNRVVLLEYPRKGLYALAFTTGPSQGPIKEALPGEMVNCFVPTTPNPTSGFYLLAQRNELIEVDITVEEAFKVVMSAGLVTPEKNGAQAIAPPTELLPAARSAGAAGD